MQAACWIGRDAHAALGGVSAHLYAEFDGRAIDVARLAGALEGLYRAHPMLSLRIDGQGRQTVDEAPRAHLELEDFSDLDGPAVERRLLEKRRQWGHQRLDLGAGQGARFGVSLLPGNACRLHVDTDMIAVDPSSFRVLMEDLARLYESPESILPSTPSYFDWLDQVRADADLRAARGHDRAWWRARLAQIAPAPSLPLLPAGPARSERFAARLEPAQYRALQHAARAQRITSSALMLGLFATALGEHTGDRRLRLNVPVFWREPLLEPVQRIVGEFANLVLVDVDFSGVANLAALCRDLHRQLVERLAHSAYPGVDLMRDLSRHHGTPQLAPVVFTAGLDLPGGELFSERVSRVFGPMGWVISQGPQVALDAQVARADGGLLINWDVRLDALPADWVQALFERFIALAVAVATDMGGLHQPLAIAASRDRPLNALQQAYLLGRGEHLPLGGVAMQEFREYRGRLDLALLRSRLTDMVRRHDSLRTRIDAQALTQSISDQVQVNLEVIDLHGLTAEQAQAQLEVRREDYAHALFDLAGPPWNVTAFQLPQGELVVFVRFDALILDGRSIATLMVELFDGHCQPLTASEPTTAIIDQSEVRKADAEYWKAKLAEVDGAPRLPWRQALDKVGVARYARQRQIVSAQAFKALSRAGAREGLFKNSTIMAVVLEVLGHWLDEGSLCVAVPVAPPQDGAFANRSSFIAVDWQRGLPSLAERAKRLQADVLEGLQHLAFSGVDLARLLYDSNGPGPALPVVLTNGLSWPVGAVDGPMTLSAGLTQTPQVAMDIRFCNTAEGGLAFEIDYAREAVDGRWVGQLLAALNQAVAHLAGQAAFEVHARQFIDLGHYRLNSSEAQAEPVDFLGRIAHNLFGPDNGRIALLHGERRISYAELGEGVKRIAGAFQARGLRPGQVVAICLPRGPEHTMTTLACALSGLVWVPIDAAAPEERLRYLLDNCQPALVVDAVAPLLASPPAALDLTGLAALSASTAPAYYLYTSGTTGKPKCVVLNNRATANVIGSTLAQWQVSRDDVFISVTPLHHDMSLFDVFGSLCAGAALVLPEPGEEKDALRWNQLVRQHGVSLWCSVPAILEMLLACRQGDGLRSLRLLAQGGDYIKPAVIAELRELLPEARLVSLGGPTETTIWSIWHEIGEQDRARVPYGRPLPGNRYWLLDEHGAHCPQGVAGRIHTSGVGLALGYLEDGKLVQNDFVNVLDEHGAPVRAFRTGDRGRYREDGVLLFDSRVNGYVKVRGVRVSLPDIEIELIRYPAVQQVLVVDYGDTQQGEACIGALYVRRNGAPPGALALREHARALLPQSHVPTRFVEVDALPLTANGKPDRRLARALLEGDTEQAPIPAAVPSDPQRHAQVLAIYQQVLGATQPARDFLAMGLRPQHLKPLAARLGEAFAVRLSPAQLLPCRTVEEVERLLVSAPM
ncbi:amino acid adenylation domain-containing protein [Pseudomonas sp. 2848]|uniref:amino acid adenylation domain-containing protein n=1 Tax=Pseudomonas sp. 2848 TaxID=2183926 RepID=UPI000DB2C883|nr:amino acid adenylation domain-containing protein [Pseudomonas sp. 2848]PZW77435.1 amino acid adenylation domain-containing protein [Pseudomonas sp. 2848]